MCDPLTKNGAQQWLRPMKIKYMILVHTPALPTELRLGDWVLGTLEATAGWYPYIYAQDFSAVGSKQAVDVQQEKHGSDNQPSPNGMTKLQ